MPKVNYSHTAELTRSEQAQLELTQAKTKIAAMTASKKGFQRKTSSFNAVVADLEVGECASKVIPLPDTLTVAQMAEQLSTLKQQAQNNVKDAMRRARADTGGTYSLSTSDTITPGGEVYIVLIIRRTA